jgi:hypothetical protein
MSKDINKRQRRTEMPFTLRIFTDPDLTTWEDSAHDTLADAYAVIFVNPAPYGEENMPVRTDHPMPHGYVIAGPSGNDPDEPDNIVLTGIPELCGKPL